MQTADPAHTVVLMENHDQAALDFLSHIQWDSWLGFGGTNTLVAAVKVLGGAQSLTRDRQLVLEQQADLIAWMRALPVNSVAGKICFVHTGLDRIPRTIRCFGYARSIGTALAIRLLGLSFATSRNVRLFLIRKR